MTKFAHKGLLRQLPVQVSTAQQGESKNVKNVLYAAAKAKTKEET